MRGLKRGIAFAMASTMLLGSGISAMADGSSVTGDGHYTQENIEETISVTLPTRPEGETPFDYIMDPDGNVPRLVDNGSAVFGEDLKNVPEEDLPGLYYVTGTERIRGKDVPVFSAKSASLKLVNESACAVAIGVGFEVKDGDVDFTNNNDCYASAKIRGVDQFSDVPQENELMLTVYASNGNEATVDKVMPVFVEDDDQQDYDVVSEIVYKRMEGKEDNFVFTLTEDEGPDYVCAYNRKQDVESWPAVDFYMSGKINEFVDELPDELVRPRVTVTWTILSESDYNELLGGFEGLEWLDTYQDPVGPAQPSIGGDIFAAEEVPEGDPLVVRFNKGGSEGITSLQYFNGNTNTWISYPAVVDIDNEAGTITFDAAYVDAFRGSEKTKTWRATFAPIGEDDPVSEEFMIVSRAN